MPFTALENLFCQLIKLTAAPCPIQTPLGSPVDPEVYKIYAAFCDIGTCFFKLEGVFSLLFDTICNPNSFAIASSVSIVRQKFSLELFMIFSIRFLG